MDDCVKMNIAGCKNNKKYCHKSIRVGVSNTFQKQYWCWYRQYFCQSIVIGIDNNFLPAVLTSLLKQYNQMVKSVFSHFYY